MGAYLYSAWVVEPLSAFQKGKLRLNIKTFPMLLAIGLSRAETQPEKLSGGDGVSPASVKIVSKSEPSSGFTGAA